VESRHSCGRVVDSGLKAEVEGVFSTDDIDVCSNCGEVGLSLMSLIDVGGSVLEMVE